MRTRPRASGKGSRGPVARKATNPYDCNLLEESMSRFVEVHGTEKAFDLGVYWTLPVNFAVRGMGLLHCAQLLLCILEVTFLLKL